MDLIDKIRADFKVENGVLLRYHRSNKSFEPCGVKYFSSTNAPQIRTTYKGVIYPNRVLAYIVYHGKMPHAVRCLNGDNTDLRAENLIELPKCAQGVRYSLKAKKYRASVRIPRQKKAYPLDFYDTEQQAAGVANLAQPLADSLTAKGFPLEGVTGRVTALVHYYNELLRSPRDSADVSVFKGRYDDLCDKPYAGAYDIDQFS